MIMMLAPVKDAPPPKKEKSPPKDQGQPAAAEAPDDAENS
jgi:hypothetical protein